ncbi:MAG TPA: hypothetical protein DD723_04920 [Candidatus Omnitrophica bacterium]|nr:hypothetical protein [Candidatus Omnitrophota bacterium]
MNKGLVMRQTKILSVCGGFSVLLILLFCAKTEAFFYEDKIAVSKGLAHYAIGQMHDLLGQSDLAVLEYEKAVQFDETSHLLHLRLGTDYARLNMLSEAEAELQLVNKYNPEDLQSHYLLALIYSTQKEYDKAAGEYEFILKSFAVAEPQNIEVYGYLGQLYYSQRKFDQAIEQFERILAIEPENADVMYLLSSLYLEVNKRDLAIKLLKKSIAIDPEHDGSLNTLGYLYTEDNHQLEEAEKLITRALKLSPDNGAYLDSLGWVYYKKEKYEEALEILKKADAVLKDSVIYDHMGDVYYKLNRFEDAVKHWELSLELLPEQQEVAKKINDVKNFQANLK